MTMEEIMEAAVNTKEYYDFVVGKNREVAEQVKQFLYTKRKRSWGTEKGEWSFITMWQGLKKKMGDKGGTARADLSKEMVKFVDMFIDEWNNLPSIAQTWITLEVLSGQEADVNVLKLPPLKLMDKKIIKRYLPMFEGHLRQMDPNLTKEAPKTSRTQAKYINTLGQIQDRYEQLDEKFGACKV